MLYTKLPNESRINWRVCSQVQPKRTAASRTRGMGEGELISEEGKGGGGALSVMPISKVSIFSDLCGIFRTPYKMPGTCLHTYVYIKSGCDLVRRLVYMDEKKRKYVRLNATHVFLNDLRGKYRYADK